jgi:non-specific serine/threonine protein kinase/serine/threonine-protein kinase
MSLEAEQRLFDACLDAADPEARERILTSCPDTALVGRVRRLLIAHLQGSDTIQPSAALFPRIAAPHRIGPYCIVQRLGEGAMGEVYLAEQQAPVRRRVALKILKFGLSTREVVARFALERDALAMLTHPNIARIFDAGTTPDGRPFFAMECVDGLPITKYCDQHRLGLAERLQLFESVCEGVQHAHLRGIIHRDLKPSNILVTELDGRAVPKIIDFGIAKATTATATNADEDSRTRFGHVLGTPEYMSPEQAQLAPLDIDARTDVYSLGVVLYELLTGSRPYTLPPGVLDPSVLLAEIQASDPCKPSVRVMEDAEGAAERASARAHSPSTLAAALRGDLDWIVLKALEKDRQRRYLSAAEMAADLKRHSLHEAVSARPPSMAYRLSRFALRHRLAVAAASTLFVAAIVFGSGMAMLARQAALERDRANQEAAVARRVTAFTAGLFELASPSKSGASDITARALLDLGVHRLESEDATERTEVRAALFEAAGNAYRGLGDYERASSLLEQAVKLREVDAVSAPAAHAKVLLSQAMLVRSQGNFKRAEELARASIQQLEGAGVEEDALSARLELVDVLRLQSRLDEAAELVSDTLARYARIPAGGSGVARSTFLLGKIRAAQGRMEDAERELTRALEMHRRVYGDFSEPTRAAKDGLADALVTMGKSDRAEPLLREAANDARRMYGPNHPEVGIALSNLGNALSDFPEKFAEAEQVYLQAVALHRVNFGPKHPELAIGLNNLGSLYLRQKEWEKARDAYTECLEIRTAALGPHHPDTAAAQLGEALALNKLNKFSHAERLLRSAVTTMTAELGADHWRTANVERYLGTVLTNLGHYREADEVLTAAESKLEKALGKDHPRTESARVALEELAAARQRASAHAASIESQ